MLKIKDNVNLKILEKYGFELNGFLSYQKRVQGVTIIYRTGYNPELYLIRKTENAYIDDRELDTIYDLIKANLVEKVGNNGNN